MFGIQDRLPGLAATIARYEGDQIIDRPAHIL
jgi:hypothetical protein